MSDPRDNGSIPNSKLKHELSSSAPGDNPGDNNVAPDQNSPRDPRSRAKPSGRKLHFPKPGLPGLV